MWMICNTREWMRSARQRAQRGAALRNRVGRIGIGDRGSGQELAENQKHEMFWKQDQKAFPERVVTQSILLRDRKTKAAKRPGPPTASMPHNSLYFSLPGTLGWFCVHAIICHFCLHCYSQCSITYHRPLNWCLMVFILAFLQS